MKNRHFLLAVLLLVFSASMIAQNKIGDNPSTIQAGSLLELESLTKGLRLPRVPLNDVTKWTLDGTPVSGMVVYNDAGTEPKGLYYWSIELTKWVQVQNTADLTLLLANKVDKVAGKDLSTNDYTTADMNKLAAITGTNTGDQDLTPYAKITDVNTSLALKEDIANKSSDVVADAASTTKYPAVKAIKDYVDVAVAGATIADADATTKGKIQLAGDLGGTAAAPTVPGLTQKVDKTITVNGQALSANVTLTKTDLGLANVDNTTDLAKPISTATQTALDSKADKSITVNGQALSANVTLTKTDLGLANVDNTTDLAKPISTATQTALDSKTDKSITVNGQALSANVTLTKTDLGLANVDNTTDLAKPISIATQTALDAKEATITAGTTAQYYRGDKTWTALDKTAVGLANVDNTTDLAKPISTATQTALDLKAPLVSPAFTGTPTAPTAAAFTNNTEIATTAFVTTAVAAATIADADATTKGKIQLAGDLTGTAAAPTIANGAVTNAKLATDAVTTTNILDGTIAAVDLDANAVTTAKIADAAVTTAKMEGLADGKIIVGVDGTSVGNAKVSVTGDVTMLNTGVTTIAANAVTTAKIADGAITGAKIDATGAITGNVLTYNGTTWTPGSTSDATAIAKGVVQLGGDLAGTGGTAAAPKITDGAVTTAKMEGLADGKIIVGVDGTSAGNAKVSVTGDVTMTNAGVTKVEKIQNVAVATTAPTDGQVLTYNLGTTKWTAAPVSAKMLQVREIGGASYTVLPDDDVLITTSGQPAITLPDPTTCKGRVIYMVDLGGTGALSLTPVVVGPQTNLADDQALTIVSTGSYWCEISGF